MTELEELFCHLVCRGLEKPRKPQSRYLVPCARSEPGATQAEICASGGRVPSCGLDSAGRQSERTFLLNK